MYRVVLVSPRSAATFCSKRMNTAMLSHLALLPLPLDNEGDVPAITTYNNTTKLNMYIKAYELVLMARATCSNN